MEKKNINIGVVRICTILLLTVFTIGRKYGEEQKATELINNLKQQPCACCLNFENVDASAGEIDEAKRQLEEHKKILEDEKVNLANEKRVLEGRKDLLQNQIDNLQYEKGQLQGQLETAKTRLEEEIKAKENNKNQFQNEKDYLQGQINNLRKGNNEDAGAEKVAKVLNEKFDNYIKDLNETKKFNMQIQSEKQKISEENAKLEKTLNESKEKLKEKDKEIEDTKKQIEELKNTKEKIENDLKIKNNEIESCKKSNSELTEHKTKLENDLKKLEEEYKKNYESTVVKNDEVVGKNTEEIKKINGLLVTWKDENDKITKEIKDKTQEIKELNNKIKENNSRINELNEEKEKLNSDYNNLNIAHENLKQNHKEIEQKKKELEDSLNVCKGQMEYLTTQTNTLNDILKNTKTNVNMEEYASLYNSINAQKRTNISILLNRDVESFPEKQYTFYIPFKFKDYGQCSLKKTISEVFAKNPGIYTANLSLYEILRSFFEIKAFEKFKEWKIIKVTNLKEIYFDVSFPYEGDKIKIEGKGMNVEENRKKNIELPKIVISPKTQSDATYNMRNKKKEVTKYDDVANGTAYEKCMNRFFLDYSNLIELVGIDEYLNKRGEGKIEDKKDKVEDKEDLFLLELDFKDPECIALLESVGKGNYGVVKKGLTFENGKLVTKAIKFTCSNFDFENSKEENILKEIRAGKIVNEIGVGNKIAFVKDYMKIKEFKKRYDYKKEEGKIFPLEKETEDGDLTNAVYTTFLNDNLKTLPVGKEDVRKDFQNNVFNMNGNIGKDLYIMFLDLVNGEDLFLKEKKEELDINNLGDILFDVLKNLYVCGVALKDIKPKNIMCDEKNNEFSIIDVQTLEKVGRNLTDSCGTPELWPFFKTLNLNLESKNEIINEDKKDNLYDRFCNSIDDNFVDIYAACMTMYFAKFSTYTAAGLLTLLLKWLVLDKENKDKKGWETFSLNDKIEFLKKYNDNYKKYINFVNRKENKEPINKNLEDSHRKKHKKIKNKKNVNKINTKEDECSDIIKFFFENIDDKNLNKEQKNVLADLLKKVITTENGSNIFYLLNEIKDEIKLVNEENLKEEEKEKKREENEKEKEKKEEKTDEEKIITFYKLCVEKDFENFAKLSNWECKYADVIKYVLCYGSCLNYNGGIKEEMNVNTILKQLNLKENIEINDEEFFDNTNNLKKDVIDKLKKGFNQKFIFELLNILPLEEYNEILEHGVNKDSVDYHFENKKKSKEYEQNDIKIDTKKKVFYLLKYLEINKLFHIPKNILKINSLIKNNTKNQLEVENGKNKK